MKVKKIFTFKFEQLFIYKIDVMKRSKEFLEQIVKESKSIADVCRKCGIQPKGGNYAVIKKEIEKYKIDIRHFTGQRWNKGKKTGPKRKLSQILIDGNYCNSSKLKDRLIKEGVKKEKCEWCGSTEWLGLSVPLELHHINGNHFDNRLENLILLCPNCHALTHNYRGKNIGRENNVIGDSDFNNSIELLKEREKERDIQIYRNHLKNGDIRKTGERKVKEKKYCQVCGEEILGRGEKYCSYECAKKALLRSKYNKEKLIEDSKTVKSVVELGKLYGVSDNAIRKHLKSFGILEECKNNFIRNTKK